MRNPATAVVIGYIAGSLSTAAERDRLHHVLAYAVVGSAGAIHRGLHAIIEKTQAGNLMLAGHFYDEAARLYAFSLAAEALRSGQR